VSLNGLPQASLSLLGDGSRAFFAGTSFSLSDVSYAQEEYLLSGSARAFQRASGSLSPVEEAGFITRIIVIRPQDDDSFNGTVWIEWLNVSGGLDAAPGWIFTHTELIRTGAAWVGVSAQRIGVEGGDGLLGMKSPGLVGTNPARYGGLKHPGDRFSYDIFSQASMAARKGDGTILQGLPIDRLLAIGDSQSAFRLTTYVNEFDPIFEVHDGFMIHARGGTSAPLDDAAAPSDILTGDPVLFREDLRVPVFCVEAETDLVNLRYLSARQENSEKLTVWEIAGCAHADVYTFVAGSIDNGLLPIDKLARAWAPVSEIFGMKLNKPVNSGPQHYLRVAAMSHLDRWVRDGKSPPEAPRLEIRDGAFVKDSVGNVKGGVRTPHVDVPTAVLSGLGNGGHPISFLCGTTEPLDAERLRALYKSPNDYLERFRAATRSTADAGFVLDPDETEIVQIAELNSPLRK